MARPLEDISVPTEEINFGNVVCFLLGNSPASEFHMPTFRNTLLHLHRRAGTYPSMMTGTDIQNTAKV